MWYDPMSAFVHRIYHQSTNQQAKVEQPTDVNRCRVQAWSSWLSFVRRHLLERKKIRGSAELDLFEMIRIQVAAGIHLDNNENDNHYLLNKPMKPKWIYLFTSSTVTPLGLIHVIAADKKKHLNQRINCQFAPRQPSFEHCVETLDRIIRYT